MRINLKKKLAPYTAIKTGIIYPEDEDCELGNNAEPIKEYPDEDPMDLAKENYINEHMRGEH